MVRCFRRFKFILMLFFVFTPTSALAGVIVYGNDFSFNIEEPKGWIVDTESGQSNGVNVVLYEKGQTWADAPVVMYVNVSDRGKGIVDTIAYDSANFKKNCPTIKITKFDANSRIFDCPDGEYEIVSYIDVGDKICLLVMSGRSKTMVDKRLSAYREFVRSFHWLTSNIKIN